MTEGWRKGRRREGGRGRGREGGRDGRREERSVGQALWNGPVFFYLL